MSITHPHHFARINIQTRAVPAEGHTNAFGLHILTHPRVLHCWGLLGLNSKNSASPSGTISSVLFSLLHVQLMRNNIKLLLSTGKKLNFTSDFKTPLPLYPEEFPPLKLKTALSEVRL